MHGHRDRHAIERAQRIYVIAIVGFEDYDLVTGIEQRQACRVEGPSGTCRYHNFPLRIGVNTVVIAHFASNRAPKIGHAVEARVRILTRADGIYGSPLYRLGNFRIADPLRQIDAASPFALDRHDANGLAASIWRRGSAIRKFPSRYSGLP